MPAYLRLLIATATATLVAATSGLFFAYSSSLALSVLLGSQWMPIFVGCGSVGGFFGSLLSGYLLSTYGRQWTMVCSTFIGAIGWFDLFWSSNSIYQYHTASSLLMLGRIVTGISAGLAIPGASSYLVEISPANKLRYFGFFPQIGIVFGILLAYIWGSLLPWELITVVNGIIMFLLMLSCCMLPESPKWLQKSGKSSSATVAISWLFGSSDTRPSLEDQKQLLPNSDQVVQNRLKWFTYLLPYLEIPIEQKSKLYIIMCLMVLQQLTGINAILFHAETICSFSASLTSWCTIIIGVAQLIFTLVATVILQYTNRKVLLQTSSLIMCISHLLYGLILYFNATDVKFISQLLLVLFIFGFSLGWGPVPILLSVDLFPTSTRGYAVSTAISTNWVASFFVTTFYAPLNGTLGSSQVIWLFSGCCFLSFLFVRRYIHDSSSNLAQPKP